MRKVDDGEKKKEKRKEKNVIFSGHYVIASSRPPEHWNAARSRKVKKSSHVSIGAEIVDTNSESNRIPDLIFCCNVRQKIFIGK